ncbi:hypothetical protein SAMN02745181_0521 [Rubritalea squalenifaciens DSM 18772]|uniref:Uncharacterized protein n=1 Tax=Rubritalea squalenifaciens DSM 18772 TaxID=1123071 RepID=A0A1M6CMT5_9BACT|nr:hypothetical protein [Rubritalea squalenifaciens]SHI62345.1 hypothetical protein SAMN02745181_0521 [Rubritalea squalenifaciens DSM 18772]
MKHGMLCSGFALVLICASCKQGDSSVEETSCCEESASHEKKAEGAEAQPTAEGQRAAAIRDIHLKTLPVDSYSAVDVSLVDAVKPLERMYNDQIGGFDSRLKLKFVVTGHSDTKLTLVVKNLDLGYVLDILCAQAHYSYNVDEKTMELRFYPITD